jgi:hypothetical protein
MDCRVKPGNDRKQRLDSSHAFTFSLRDPRPSDAPFRPPQNQRAQGMPGAWRTRSLACKSKKAHERSHYRFTDNAGIPCTMVLTASFVISSVNRALLPPSPCGISRQT